MDDQRQLRTVPEVARELRVHRESVYRAIRRGDIEVVRFGGVIRVPAVEVRRIKQPTRAAS